MVDHGAGYRVLESDTWTLSLVQMAPDVATTIDISVPARRRTEVPVKLAFPVASIDEVRVSAGALGGLVDPPDTQWAFEGFRRCDGVDPEGNVIQLLGAGPRR
jgi:hypothetical protein